MTRLWILLLTLLLIVTPTLAQDDEGDDETADNPPSIVSLTPSQATITGTGVVLVEVEYDDPDGDAIRFDWTMVETDMLFFQLPDGRFNQGVVGTTITVPFRCTGSPYTAVIALEVVDDNDNRSDVETFTLNCEAVEEPEPPAEEPQPPANTDTPPTITSIDPSTVTIGRFSTVVVDVTYDDPDGDATTFIWDMIETNALQWELPDGNFDQAVVGTTIPVTFFCSTPRFTATIQLIVADANGNESEPETFEMTCR